jgi:5-methylcytosine-specific restriction endonuclease McrA
MATAVLPSYTPDQPAAAVDAALRQALAACDRARECAVLWFAEVQRRELFRALGHPSLELYAVHELGFSRNRYWQFKRLADDLDRLPALREAVATGELGWTKAQQVARVAGETTQAAWVAKAKVTGRRELEREVLAARRQRRNGSSAQVGQLELGAAVAPAQVAALDITPSEDPPTTITLRADGLQLARFEALVERARKRGVVPRTADRMDLVLAALEALVDGPAAAENSAPAKGPAARIVIHQCPDCGRAAAVTARGERTLAPAQVAAVECDAQVVQAGQRNRATIPPKVRIAVLARDRHRCATPGCGAAHFLEVHHVVPRGLGGSNRADNLVTLCSRCHRFAHEQIAPAQLGAAGLAP